MSRAFFCTVLGLAIAGWTTAAACGGNDRASVESDGETSIFRRVASALGVGGADSLADLRGIPRYIERPFTSEERDLLNAAFGIEDPSKLYVDSSDGARLKYDTKIKRCLLCYVNSYGVGFVSVRRPGETWEAAEERVHHLRRRDFPATALVESISLDLLDPGVQGTFEKMLIDAKSAGFTVQVVATYRSPEREAFLMSLGGNRTHTLTSMHSYGRAIDVAISGGNIRRPKTRADWIAFRRWLVDYDQREFRVLGQIDHTWDWRHIEIRSDSIGFGSIDAALEAARRCIHAAPAGDGCTFPPNLPAMTVHDSGPAHRERTRR